MNPFQVKMENEIRGHVVLLPFPAQGHMNPLLQFGKLLTTKGIKVTLATTIFLSKSIHIKPSDVSIETISDGSDETSGSFDKGYLERFKEVGSRTLKDLIKNHESSCNPVSCLVYDSICPWVLDVAKELGLIGASFFTQSTSVSSIYYHAYQGVLKAPVNQPTICIPGLPPLNPPDMPSSLYALSHLSSVTLDLLMSQFSNFEIADYVLFNTFDKLEAEVVSWMTNQWPHIKTIGPLTPTMYLDKQIKFDKDHPINLFKPSESPYLEWLNAKKRESVIYVSFGSVVPLSEDDMEELAWGLRNSNKHFLWVVRETEELKLPIDFVKETSDKGLVVKWCSQMEVLAHEAIGCFVTHCGWNSVLEGLSFEVPLVAMPKIWDQPTNAKFVADVWGVGIRAKANDKGIVGREELLFCIREVMEGERRKVIKRNISTWMASAKDATDIGGSSYVNIENFIACLASV
ncbi:hypothetical protein GIB67_002778 [Kingdonia uniflora]|uniref:Glycosyltransferase n=1 Tax=Kingdonia uniflora TaxID=39325 RepID=A0A7J7LT29_9MAGN|nr:hypothetical protein GIB67_002778 [Kingdonia uniflora]